MTKEYITKDSGERQEYSTGMKRDLEKGKPRFDLLFVEGMPYKEQLLTQYALLRERGARKYDARNCEKACTEEELRRFKSSASRHFAQWMCDEDDEAHGPAVLFNLQMAEMVKWKLRNKK